MRDTILVAFLAGLLGCTDAPDRRAPTDAAVQQELDRLRAPYRVKRTVIADRIEVTMSANFFNTEWGEPSIDRALHEASHRTAARHHNIGRRIRRAHIVNERFDPRPHPQSGILRRHRGMLGGPRLVDDVDRLRALKAEGVTHDLGDLPFRGSEDFGQFGKTRPAAMFFLGAGEKHPSFGFIWPWIKYFRPECQLRFEFFKSGKIRKVSTLEPNWQPGPLHKR